MRAAVLTASPKTSSRSSSTGPAWKPMRMPSCTSPTAGRSAVFVCMSTAAWNAASALSNTAMTSSPIVLTTRPRLVATARLRISSTDSTAASAARSPSFS